MWRISISEQTVFILLRVRSYAPYFEKSLDSIVIQDFCGSITLIILEDNSKKTKEDIIKEKIAPHPHIQVIYDAHVSGNAACASYKIKTIAIEQASEGDIILTLDDDDELIGTGAVSAVVNRMNQTGANLVVVEFLLIDREGAITDAKKDDAHNKLVKKIGSRQESITITEERDLFKGDSLGCTKIWKASLFKKYHHIINDIRQDKTFHNLTAYEDFPDFLVFLFPETKVTALGIPFYAYRRYEDTVTARISRTAFEQDRTIQLKLLVKAAKTYKQHLITDYQTHLNQYLAFKVVRIIGIMAVHEARLNGYTNTDFLLDCIDLFSTEGS